MKILVFILITISVFYAKPFNDKKNYQPSIIDKKIFSECEYILDRYGEEDKETYDLMYKEAQGIYNTFESYELSPKNGFTKIHHLLQKSCEHVKSTTSQINGRYSKDILISALIFYYDSRK